MKSIRSLILPFLREFKPENDSTRNRLVEAFKILEDNLLSISGGSSSGKNYCQVYSSAALTIPTATPTTLIFNSTGVQNGGMHSNTTQNTRLTITKEGLYDIWANIQWPPFAVAGTPLTIQIQKNGAILIASKVEYSPAAPGLIDQDITGTDYSNVGDYIEILVTQTSGGNLIIPVVAAYSPYAFIKEN